MEPDEGADRDIGGAVQAGDKDSDDGANTADHREA